MIDVVQAAAWYAPHDVGGTEVYLEGLVAGLRTRGIESAVIVPRHPAAGAAYRHRQTLVETYPVNSEPAPDEFASERPHDGFEAFRSLLARHAGAIYHQHSWTRGCGPHHLAAARAMGFRTVLTVHVPGNICLRGTMLRFGDEICDGRIDAETCGACWAQARGLPRPLAGLLAKAPAVAARAARRAPGRAATALATREIGEGAARRFQEMVRNADRIVAVCQWLADALALNGAPRDKIVLSRQGVASDFRAALAEPARDDDGHRGMRLLYVGRIDPIKGLDNLVRAFTQARATGATLTICGLMASADETYLRRIRGLAERDSRITLRDGGDRAELPAIFAAHDVLAVPSTLLETGPLVVLEAQAAGLYVLGSNLGGVAELVAPGEDGELVEACDMAAWSAAIERLARRFAKNPRRRAPRQVRTMDAAAGDMAELYRSL